jgi:hypothetical protein
MVEGPLKAQLLGAPAAIFVDVILGVPKVCIAGFFLLSVPESDKGVVGEIQIAILYFPSSLSSQQVAGDTVGCASAMGRCQAVLGLKTLVRPSKIDELR